MKIRKFLLFPVYAVIIILCLCSCEKKPGTLESWAYDYEPTVEALRLCDDGTAVFDGTAYTYTKDDSHIILTDNSGQVQNMRYVTDGDGIVIYKIKTYILAGTAGHNGVIGIWNENNSSFQFTDKGTFLEDNVFPGHYFVDEEQGTIKLCYNDPFEDTIFYYSLDGDDLRVEYPWPMVKTVQNSASAGK
ncbi:MAG: hypothetical protein J6X60_02060 [Ruminiclostridium sp.]|nr:hypothetical protein [Ruminiclostridium sp.]